MQKKYQEIAQQYGRSVEEIKEYFRSQNMENVLFEDVLREKAFNDIISKAVIKEVEEKKNEQGD
ncbi:Trigger factor [bacterium HR13]|nr:Trigger factor [bacterium HR13]